MRFEVRILSRPGRRRLSTVLMSLALLLGAMPSSAVAIDPQPVPSAGASTPPVRPDGLVLDVPRTQAPGDFGVPNFQEDIVWSNLYWPMVIQFAADGRVFVAEKSGLIKRFDSLDDQTATIVADLRTNVHNFWDRGLLGMALDPDFVDNGRMYVAYAYDAAISGTAPVWGIGETDDGCPNPPGAVADGCLISARLSVLVDGDETVLINDWCQQFPSHSIGDIKIDGDGALIVSGGEGASFNYSDYGQTGNPCGDPPGGTMTLPSAEGGALRSQDIRTSGDATSLSGTVIRVNRFTGAPMPDNPRTTGSTNERRIIAYGLRNPFRLALHPVSGELWIGDVGWTEWEEINRHGSPTGSVRNYGWPCREGASLQPGIYGSASLCTSLTSWVAPHFAWTHDAETIPDDGCGNSTSSISGLAFYPGGPYPDIYDNALFFTDYSRQCLWVMRAGTNGVPDPAQTSYFADLGNPVYLTIGPGGDLFYVNLGGSIRRIRYLFDNDQPTADVTADPTDGPAPLTVDFDASGSTDPNTDPLTYAWDFGDNDGQFNDAFEVAPQHTYTEPGTYTARVRVSDGRGGTDVDQVLIDVANTRPVAEILSPSASLHWSVGDEITFSGIGTDAEDGTLPAISMDWSLVLAHCPDDDCHEHPIQGFSGVTGGTFEAPDHEYPSHLVLRLTVTDSFGATDSTELELDPQTVVLHMRSTPAGMTVTAGWHTDTTPFDLTVIRGSEIQLGASDQLNDGFPYTWTSWSDGGGATHTITATATRTLTATFSGGFSDVPVGAPFRSDIAWLARHGITTGCTPTTFCPTAAVTREQMASFLVRTLGLTGSAPDAFTDDETSVHEADINRLAAAGIAAGCTPTTFCPKQVVTREQMASFLARALELDGPAPDAFTDDEASIHETDINRIAAAGVTSGCTPTTFCPKAPVTRGQMAAFLHRGFADLFPE